MSEDPLTFGGSGDEVRAVAAGLPRSYEEAVDRLEEIIARLDSNKAGLRETLDLCREGRQLIDFAARELETVGKGLEELKLDELIARLESAQPAS